MERVKLERFYHRRERQGERRGTQVRDKPHGGRTGDRKEGDSRSLNELSVTTRRHALWEGDSREGEVGAIIGAAQMLGAGLEWRAR